MSYTPPEQFAPPPTPARILAARERAVSLLTDRFADESLTEAEFEARLQWLSGADSVARIEDLVADLAVPRAPAVIATPYHTLTLPEERIISVMSATRRNGHWAVPGRLEVVSVMSEVRLDLRHAVLPPVLEVEVKAVMSNVRLIVAPDTAVEARISPFMGAFRNDAGDTPWPGYGAPRIVLRGTCVMSEVRVQVRARNR